jgi:hypothetical protein
MDQLADAGAFALCTTSHSSVAGFAERGSVRPLAHPAVEAAPQFFDVVVSAERIKEVNDG